MNDKRIQQVLDIEQQARGVYEAAVNDARQIPAQAEQEAQALIDKARADAEAEAQKRIASAKSGEEGKQILEQTEEKTRKTDILAKRNFDRAVAGVLRRVAGKE